MQNLVQSKAVGWGVRRLRQAVHSSTGRWVDQLACIYPFDQPLLSYVAYLARSGRVATNSHPRLVLFSHLETPRLPGRENLVTLSPSFAEPGRLGCHSPSSYP